MKTQPPQCGGKTIALRDPEARCQPALCWEQRTHRGQRCDSQLPRVAVSALPLSLTPPSLGQERAPVTSETRHLILARALAGVPPTPLSLVSAETSEVSSCHQPSTLQGAPDNRVSQLRAGTTLDGLNPTSLCAWRQTCVSAGPQFTCSEWPPSKQPACWAPRCHHLLPATLCPQPWGGWCLPAAQQCLEVRARVPRHRRAHGGPDACPSLGPTLPWFTGGLATLPSPRRIQGSSWRGSRGSYPTPTSAK